MKFLIKLLGLLWKRIEVELSNLTLINLIAGVLESKMISDDEISIPGTPPELVEAVNTASLELLPKKSREKYENAYRRFMDYRMSKNTSSFSENVVMAYFLDLCLKMKSSTLWSNYSMLKSTLALKHNVDISTYSKLRSLLKRQAQGYRAKKSKILTKEEIEKFIQEAPDKENLMIKVIYKVLISI